LEARCAQLHTEFLLDFGWERPLELTSTECSKQDELQIYSWLLRILYSDILKIFNNRSSPGTCGSVWPLSWQHQNPLLQHLLSLFNSWQWDLDIFLHCEQPPQTARRL